MKTKANSEVAQARARDKMFVVLRVVPWSDLDIHLHIDATRGGGVKPRPQIGGVLANTVGFLPVYRTLGELTKQWGGDAPYITVETIQP